MFTTNRLPVRCEAFYSTWRLERLDKYAQQLCPVPDVSGQTGHWSIRQIEYSTDLINQSAAAVLRNMLLITMPLVFA